MTEQSPEYTTPATHITLVAKPRTEAERTALIVSTPWVSVRHGNVLAERDALRRQIERLQEMLNVMRLPVLAALGAADQAFLRYAIHHQKKGHVEKSAMNTALMEQMSEAIGVIQGAYDAYDYKKMELECEVERLKQVIHGHERDLLNQSIQIKDLIRVNKELDESIHAIGAGGVEPLRKFEPAALPDTDQFRDATKMVRLTAAKINSIYYLYKSSTPIAFARALENAIFETAPKAVWLPADDTEGGAV